MEAGARGGQAHERMEAEKESFKGGELDRLRERHTDGRTRTDGLLFQAGPDSDDEGRRRLERWRRQADPLCAMRSPPLARPAADLSSVTHRRCNHLFGNGVQMRCTPCHEEHTHTGPSRRPARPRQGQRAGPLIQTSLAE